MRPGMRLGEALATCPQLVLVEQDPAGGRAGVGGGPAAARGRGVRGRAGRGGNGALRDAAGSSGSTAGSSRRSSGRSRRSGRRGTPRAGAAERRFAALAAANVARPGQALIVSDDRTRRVPRAAAADAAPARAGALRGARGARSTNDRTACRAAGWRRRRTTGAGRPARLEPGERRAGRDGSRRDGRRAAGRDARVPGSSRPGADAPARARRARRRPARPTGTRGAPAAEARPLGAARRRRLVAPDGDAARADRRSRRGCGSRSGRSSPSCRRRC